MLNLNDVQEGVLSVVFQVADKDGLLLLDLNTLADREAALLAWAESKVARWAPGERDAVASELGQRDELHLLEANLLEGGAAEAVAAAAGAGDPLHR